MHDAWPLTADRRPGRLATLQGQVLQGEATGSCSQNILEVIKNLLPTAPAPCRAHLGRVPRQWPEAPDPVSPIPQRTQTTGKNVLAGLELLFVYRVLENHPQLINSELIICKYLREGANAGCVWRGIPRGREKRKFGETAVGGLRCDSR